MEELEKIEVLRSRLGVSYREAKQALDAHNGDLVAALVDLEEKQGRLSVRLEACGREMLERARGWLSHGNLTRVKLKKGDETVLEFPATVGMAGLAAMLFSAPLAVAGALGAVAALANDYRLEVERPPRSD
ncbi:MAG: DUF4342 domain-containing protein [Clostridia bacterium]|jgi:hypothetical protein|nr:DUF4342 domain-containing protein [Clostridia bacterium]MDH7572211.1 DUF4342 domain-containing protein [Clostridia bacterium]